ncbi:hypothetical protein H6802_01270 [Candidatus Nomurabacteria bacterium]|uniref:Uncharacterized protein n=1 Tax=candidate division WWE3 bacterium TaxID=2053526 RepID=A0A955IW99_UNCKA|nr:hypothetical protein [candidate division WWE3 bacterium]MCB9823571.1 hypothetical protein [Candidatus Nomurabacteria bacterium]MCB9827366.1 hypothetical protein [Candidatus Nomurabacteria bacterium]HXK52759.1 hypothetical protein [bacterium]
MPDNEAITISRTPNEEIITRREFIPRLGASLAATFFDLRKKRDGLLHFPITRDEPTLEPIRTDIEILGNSYPKRDGPEDAHKDTLTGMLHDRVVEKTCSILPPLYVPWASAILGFVPKAVVKEAVYEVGSFGDPILTAILTIGAATHEILYKAPSKTLYDLTGANMLGRHGLEGVILPVLKRGDRSNGLNGGIKPPMFPPNWLPAIGITRGAVQGEISILREELGPLATNIIEGLMPRNPSLGFPPAPETHQISTGKEIDVQDINILINLMWALLAEPRMRRKAQDPKGPLQQGRLEEAVQILALYNVSTTIWALRAGLAYATRVKTNDDPLVTILSALAYSLEAISLENSAVRA